MKNLLVLFIAMSTSFTAFARELSIPALEKSLSAKLQTPVKVISIRATLNPLDMFINILDNTKIQRIKFVAKDERITCDFTSYDYAQRARIENCNSKDSISSTSFEVQNMFTCGNTAVIDGRKIRSKFDLHSAFITQLCFPAFYGENFDALYDMLVSVEKPTKVKLKNLDRLQKTLLKADYETLLLLLKEASEANSLLSVEI